MHLVLLSQSLAVCRLAPHDDIPSWARQQRPLLSITYTADELSIVCPSSSVPPTVQCERDWQAIKIQGPLDFSLTGVLSSLTVPLANANIPVFVLSTFDTDYILIKEQNIAQAKLILEEHEHVFVPSKQQS